MIEITNISDEYKRARAEKIVLYLAKKLIKDRCFFRSGKDYVNSIEDAISRFI